MKFLLQFSLIVCAVFVLNSCSTPLTAEKVAQKYASAIAKADFEMAKKFCTAEAGKTIDFLALMLDGGSVEVAKEAKPVVEAQPANFSQDGMLATVVVAVHNGFNIRNREVENVYNVELKLMKQGEQWLVFIDE